MKTSTCGDGGVPGQRDSVPPHEGGVQPEGIRVHRTGHVPPRVELPVWSAVVQGDDGPGVGVVAVHLHLYELGDVEGEGDDGDWDDVDQEPPRARHRLGDRPGRWKLIKLYGQNWELDIDKDWKFQNLETISAGK